MFKNNFKIIASLYIKIVKKVYTNMFKFNKIYVSNFVYLFNFKKIKIIMHFTMLLYKLFINLLILYKLTSNLLKNFYLYIFFKYCQNVLCLSKCIISVKIHYIHQNAICLLYYNTSIKIIMIISIQIWHEC